MKIIKQNRSERNVIYVLAKYPYKYIYVIRVM